jgi:hypothetical protein
MQPELNGCTREPKQEGSAVQIWPGMRRTLFWMSADPSQIVHYAEAVGKREIFIAMAEVFIR